MHKQWLSPPEWRLLPWLTVLRTTDGVEPPTERPFWFIVMVQFSIVQLVASFR